MTFKPTKFQQSKISEISTKVTQSLHQNIDKKVIVLKAPTGSGKTFMLSEAIKTISNTLNDNPQVSYIWIAPRKLHDQSKLKLESYFSNEEYMKCSFFSEISSVEGIKANEILFLNWESINRKEKNTIIKENEKNFNLTNIIEKTKEAGRKVVLVIDESHMNVKTEIALSLISNIVKPDITIEASATPSIGIENIENIDILSVSTEEVKADNLIVDQIILQDGIKSQVEIEKNKAILTGDDFSNKEILKKALAKRKDLEKKFKKENSTIKPLLLIQVPDKNSKGSLENLMEDILDTLASEKITKENKKLAIYLSEEKTNITGDDNQPLESVQVLIFKQAIALGWDCPRAQILVIFRDMKSFTFETQTIGRITRFPDPNAGYFLDSELNNAYIYTNLSSIGIKEDWAKSFIDYKTVFIDKKLSDIINLPSWYTKRQRERTRLRSEYKDIFENLSKKEKLKEKIKTSKNKVTNSFFSETKVDNISVFKDTMHADNNAEINDIEVLQNMLDVFAADMLRSEYFPEKRSIKRVVDSFYRFLNMEFDLDYKKISDFEKILKILLDERNRSSLHSATQKAIEAHKKFVEENLTRELSYIDKWNIPEVMMYSGVTDSMQPKYSTKSILKSRRKNLIIPNKLYKSEIEFIKKLEESDKVKWWFKNGEGDGTSFAVKTIKDNGEPAPFFVDFIVFFNNKTIGLYDTKSGNTLQTNDIESKHKGLKEAINNKHYKKYKLTGGIVSNTNMSEHTGVWRVFTGTRVQNIRDTSLQKPGWTDLDL